MSFGWDLHSTLVSVLFVLIGNSAFGSEITIELQPKNDPAAQFVVNGVPATVMQKLRASGGKANLDGLVRVYVVNSGKPAENAMSGDVELREKTIVFVPRYPLRRELTYRAVFDPTELVDQSLAKLERDFELPGTPRGEATRVTEIFPSSDVVPENLLRWYVYFSAPMSRGEAYQRIHLLDEKGKEVQFPFLELNEELWSPDGKRFSLYFDPGRIKRGLKPRELLGPVLMEGHSYSLVIDAAWIDASGRPLKESFTKKFRAVAPDDKQPSATRWKVHAPAANGREPVRLELDEPLDSGMLQRVLEIRNPTGQVVAGEIRLSNHEQRWEFVPQANWCSGAHRLLISTGIEDLAGNSIRRLFEIDILRPAVPGIDSEVVELPFAIK